MDVVDYELRPLASESELLRDKALLALTWRLTVQNDTEIEAVREQAVGVAIVSSEKPHADRAVLTNTFPALLARLASHAEQQLDLHGWDQAAWPADYLGGSDARLPHVY